MREAQAQHSMQEEMMDWPVVQSTPRQPPLVPPRSFVDAVEEMLALQASISVAGRPAGKAQPGLVAGLARIAGQRIAVKATKACRASAAPLSSR